MTDVGTINEDGLVADRPDTIAVFSGGWIRPLDPNPDDIKIEDIAHALSNQCRFTGHTSTFYSVAEHCVLAMSIVAEADKLDTLLHDASEAYLADLARPIKKAPGLGEVYLEAEAKLEQAIATRFGTTFPMSAATRVADEIMLGVEIHSLMPSDFSSRFPSPPDDAPVVRCWSPRYAEEMYLEHFARLDAARRKVA